MIPPDRSFKREANAPQASLSTLQKVVRYAEKDDLLLYMTAAFGVLMPGLMYFFYRYVHNRYQQKRRAQRQRKKQSEKSRSATIFYCSDVPATKNIAYELAENLEFDPLVAKLGPQEMEKARHSKGMQVHVFVLSKGEKQQEIGRQCHLEEFADWLDELKYERREKNYLHETRFLILSAESYEETIHSFEKRLHSLGSMPLGSAKELDPKNDLQEICTQLDDLLRRFNYGEFDEPAAGNADESVEEYSEDEGSE